MSTTMPIQIEDVDLGPSYADASVRIEPSPRWVRAFLDGKPIANSKRARLVFEPRRLPVDYFPVDDVRMDLLGPSDLAASGSEAGSPRQRWTFESGGRLVTDVGWSYVEPDAPRSRLATMRIYAQPVEAALERAAALLEWA